MHRSTFRFSRHFALFVLISGLLSLSACKDAVIIPDPAPTAYDAAKFDADPLATLWFDLAANCVSRSPGFSDPVAARSYAYLSIAMYESILPGMPKEYRSVASQLNGFTAMPKADTAGKRFHWTLSANAAAAAVMRSLFANSSAAVLKSIDSLETLCLNERFDRTHDTAMTKRSVAFGQAIAKAVLSVADADGGKDADKDNYATPFATPPDTTSWIISSAHKNPMLAAWGTNKTMVITANDLSSSLDPGAFPAFSTDKTSDFFKSATAVRSAVLASAGEERALVNYWGNEVQSPNAISSHMIVICGQLLRTAAFPLHRAIMLYTQVAVSMNDAAIATWNIKYKYPVMRPITYIQKYVDKSWQSDKDIAKLVNPDSPEYCAGTVALCEAALPAMRNFFGYENLFTDRARLVLLEMERDYYSFDQIRAEVLRTQRESGAQYAFSIDAGTKVGQGVAALCTQRLQLKN